MPDWLYAVTVGKGSPTVILEVGSMQAGSADAGWHPIVDDLARACTVFRYDRANLGRSGPAALPRTLNDFTADLRRALQSVEAQPPYLLIGGSFGGMLAVNFASLYPDEVCGVVLVDSTHPQHDKRTLALLPLPAPGEPQSLADFRALCWQEYSQPLETFEWEGLDAPASIEQAHRQWDLRDIPLTVLTAGIDEFEPDFPPDLARAYQDLWMDLQQEYCALSTRAQHIVVPDSGHLIHDRRPDVVLDAVRAIIALRSGGGA